MRNASGKEPFIEEVLRTKLTEHDLKLQQLETVGTITKEYVDELREDVIEMKLNLKPLIGLNIPSQSAIDQDKSQMLTIRRILLAIAIFLFCLVVLVTVVIIFAFVRGLASL